MGKNNPENGPQPSGLIVEEAAGYATSFAKSRSVDSARWNKAEQYTAELIKNILCTQSSDELREDVIEFVRGLIQKCFECQVYTFGSVPLKTYLPDGDIDLTIVTPDSSLKDTWANAVRSALETAEHTKNEKFHVSKVQYINAEVKLIKCHVENVVVDISFNQFGGLCTLCFLEEVDRKIAKDHFLKRSIILVKAWCYYESTILGAHHGLISTYALETLVLYIFQVFHSYLRSPLEVLLRFLEFFGKFDWRQYAVSVEGPVPLKSLPDTTAESPRKDSGELLLSKDFLNACFGKYCVLVFGQDPGRAFTSKYLNVVDFLRPGNNLGRSVNQTHFYRIARVLGHSADKLLKILLDESKDIEDCFGDTKTGFFKRTKYRLDQFGDRRPDDPRRTAILSATRPGGTHNLQNRKDATKAGADTRASDRVTGDLLSSDLKQHLENLDHARRCQNSSGAPHMAHGQQQYFAPSANLYPGPWEGPGRPLNVPAGNLMIYGPNFVQVTPSVSSSTRLVENFRPFVGGYVGDELPKSHVGTGTFLPNPRPPSYRERQSSWGNRNSYGGYSQERGDRVDREGNHQAHGSRFRGGGRGQNTYESRSHSSNDYSGVGKSSVDVKGGGKGRDDHKQYEPRKSTVHSAVPGPVPAPAFTSPSFVAVPPVHVVSPVGSDTPVGTGKSAAAPSAVITDTVGNKLATVADPLEFGSLGSVQGVSDVNRGANHTYSRVSAHGPPGFARLPPVSDDGSSQGASTMRREGQRPYQLKDSEDFPPLPNGGQHGSSSTGMNSSNDTGRQSSQHSYASIPTRAGV